jgi:hypothetical protein
MKKNKNSQPKLFVILLIAIPVVIALLSFIGFSLKPKVTSEGGQYSQKNDSTLKYDQEGVKKIQDLSQNKLPLSVSDEKVKSALVKKANPLASTENYNIAYNADKDSFKVEVTTIRINTAKDEAVNWFKTQGFSDQAICTLPVEFGIDNKDAESLRGLDIVFNPLPPGC